MKIGEFHEDKATAVKFEVVGDQIDGIIVKEPALVPDNFNEGKKVLALTLATEDGERRLFARSQMLEAIGQAVTEMGTDEICEGGGLRVVYAGDRELRSGRTMKLYKADYAPPSAMGTAELGETDPWTGETVSK